MAKPSSKPKLRRNWLNAISPKLKSNWTLLDKMLDRVEQVWPDKKNDVKVFRNFADTSGSNVRTFRDAGKEFGWSIEQSRMKIYEIRNILRRPEWWEKEENWPKPPADPPEGATDPK
jgi:hypothetical protein